MFNNCVELVMSDGEIKTVLVKAPVEGEIVIFDAIRLTVQENTFQLLAGGCVTDDELAIVAGKELQKIFGFSVTSKLDKGRDFYDVAYMLGNEWGHLAFGGTRQRGTVLISIMGQGLLAASEGWEKRLYHWLKTVAICPKITRTDLAFDWFNGEKKIEEFQPLWESGQFDRYHNRPEFECVGPWLTNDKWGKGRSVYVGTRSASVLTRAYEKGKQLGGFQSPWLRVEAELAARGVVIPLEILLTPTKYFVALYPIFHTWFGGETENLVSVKREKVKHASLTAAMDHTKRWAKNHYGPKLAVLRELLGDEELLDAICADEANPEVYKVADLSFSPAPMREAEVLPFRRLLWVVHGVQEDSEEAQQEFESLYSDLLTPDAIKARQSASVRLQ